MGGRRCAVVAVVSVGTNGTILVRATTGSKLANLHDVQANGMKEDLDIFHWNNNTSRWEPSDRLTLPRQRVTMLEGSLP